MEGATVTMVTTLVGRQWYRIIIQQPPKMLISAPEICVLADLRFWLLFSYIWIETSLIVCSILKLERAARMVNCARQQIYFQVLWNILQTSLLFCVAPIIYPYWAAVHRFFQDSWVFWSILQCRWWGLGRAGLILKDRPNRDGSLK